MKQKRRAFTPAEDELIIRNMNTGYGWQTRVANIQGRFPSAVSKRAQWLQNRHEDFVYPRKVAQQGGVESPQQDETAEKAIRWRINFSDGVRLLIEAPSLGDALKVINPEYIAKIEKAARA